MQIKAFYQWSETLKNGTVKKQRKRLCKSFVVGFMQELECATARAFNTPNDAITIKGTGGVNHIFQTGNLASSPLATEAGATIDTYGLRVGTNPAAVTVNDFNLGTQIANGLGAGQLIYGACAVGAAGAGGSTAQMSITRNFTNVSGGDITIKEIDWCISQADTGTNQRHVEVLHDLSTQLIVNGGNKTLTLTVVTTV